MYANDLYAWDILSVSVLVCVCTGVYAAGLAGFGESEQH